MLSIWSHPKRVKPLAGVKNLHRVQIESIADNKLNVTEMV